MEFLDGVVGFFQKFPQLALIAILFWCWLLKEIFQAYFKAALLISLLVGGLVSAIYSMREGHSLSFLGMKVDADTPQTGQPRI